jgi:hypothetical protein
MALIAFGPCYPRPVGLFLFLNDHFAAFVMAALGANRVRQAHLAAVAARDQVGRRQRIVCAAAVAAARAVLPFWMGWHCLTPISNDLQKWRKSAFASSTQSGNLVRQIDLLGWQEPAFTFGIHNNACPGIARWAG